MQEASRLFTAAASSERIATLIFGRMLPIISHSIEIVIDIPHSNFQVHSQKEDHKKMPQTFANIKIAGRDTE